MKAAPLTVSVLAVSFLASLSCGEATSFTATSPAKAESALATYGYSRGKLRADITDALYGQMGVAACFPNSSIVVISGSQTLSYMSSAGYTKASTPEVGYAVGLLGQSGRVGLRIAVSGVHAVFIPYPSTGKQSGSSGMLIDLEQPGDDPGCVDVTWHDGRMEDGGECTCDSGVCVDCQHGGAACDPGRCVNCLIVEPSPFQTICSNQAPFRDTTPMETLSVGQSL